MEKNLTPFVKWAGGKRQLIPAITERLPESFDTYYEPFIGGGALLLELAPKKAVIGDINAILTGTYNQLKSDVNPLNAELKLIEKEYNSMNEHFPEIEDKKERKKVINEEHKEYYYSRRDEFNELIANENFCVRMYALFIFLNKTCFNGLFRVNSKGLYNVPFANRVKFSYGEKNLLDVSDYLMNADIDIAFRDFEETCKNAKAGDFVFFDSPYAPIKPDSFDTYTKEGFALEEHQRLAKLYRELSEKGVYCMLTNHNTDLINELYDGFKIEVIQVKRMINRDADKRTGEEVIITNY